MKIRTGFVSNSSSSSYCIIGTSLTEKEINKIFSGKWKFEPNVIIMGGYCDDGDEIVELTENRYKVLQQSIKTPACRNLHFVKSHGYYEGGEQLNIGNIPDPKKARVYCGSCTINDINDVEFVTKYIQGEGLE